MEHYASPEAAREAYEAKMAAEVIKVQESRPKPTEEELAEEAAEAEKDRVEAAEMMSLLGRLATPAAREEWRAAPRNSFKQRLLKMLELREAGEHDYDDDPRFTSMVMMSAAGERAGASSNIRRWTKERLDWEVAEELNRRYQAELEGLPLERASAAGQMTPYSPDPNKVHSPELIDSAIEGAKEDLLFVAPFCEAYDRRFFPQDRS